MEFFLEEPNLFCSVLPQFFVGEPFGFTGPKVGLARKTFRVKRNSLGEIQPGFNLKHGNSDYCIGIREVLAEAPGTLQKVTFGK